MPALEGIRVFYVEDDLRNRTVVRMLTERNGGVFDYEQWGFPEIILHKLHRFHPQIILLDLNFAHQQTGYGLLQVIRQQALFKHIPVVAVSAADAALEMPKAKACGFNGFIAKPLDINLFPKQLEAVLRGGTVWYAG
jgi:CheY-like chemotaxis protein